MVPYCSSVYFLNLTLIAYKSIGDSIKKPFLNLRPTFDRLWQSFQLISCFWNLGVHANQRRYVCPCLCVQHIVASMPLLQSLYWTCRLKSLTLFSPLTAKAATVSNTNSLLSSYICSGQGGKDGSRSKKDVGQSFCPSLYSNLCLVLDFLLTWEHRNVPCIMSNTEFVIVSRI